MGQYNADWAKKQIDQLGYPSIDKVPIGVGNDYLTALVKIAKGVDFGDSGFDTIMQKVRVENRAKEGKLFPGSKIEGSWTKHNG